MKALQDNFKRILSIFPTAKGFGFAVYETTKGLIDWGAKRVHKPKNQGCITKITKLIDDYQPDTVIVPDANDPKRYQRIRKLIKQITKEARAKGVEVVTISREQVQQHFKLFAATTKYEIVVFLAEQFPPLGPMLPRPRKPWESEDYRIGMFGAVASLCQFNAGSETS